MKQNKKIYFVSDAHLGFPSIEESIGREKLFVKWLDEIKNDAEEIYLLGDIFDFWFEYKKAVPRGFTRLLGKISEITDSGIPVHFFTGNHDIWIFDYLPKETGVIIHRKPITREFNGKRFFLAHGDGLGPHDKGYKIMKKIFTNSVAQWFFSLLHPNVGISIAQFFSHKSRYSNKGDDKEWLVLFAKNKLNEQYYDYLIFGHRHIPVDIKLDEKSRFINLGDWISNFTYAVFDGKNFELKKYFCIK